MAPPGGDHVSVNGHGLKVEKQVVSKGADLRAGGKAVVHDVTPSSRYVARQGVEVNVGQGAAVAVDGEELLGLVNVLVPWHHWAGSGNGCRHLERRYLVFGPELENGIMRLVIPRCAHDALQGGRARVELEQPMAPAHERALELYFGAGSRAMEAQFARTLARAWMRRFSMPPRERPRRFADSTPV